MGLALDEANRLFVLAAAAYQGYRQDGDEARARAMYEQLLRLQEARAFLEKEKAKKR